MERRCRSVASSHLLEQSEPFKSSCVIYLQTFWWIVQCMNGPYIILAQAGDCCLQTHTHTHTHTPSETHPHTLHMASQPPERWQLTVSGEEMSYLLHFSLRHTHTFPCTHMHMQLPSDIFRLSVLLADLQFICICLWIHPCTSGSACRLVFACVCMRTSRAVSEFDLKLLLPLYSASSCVRFLGLQDMRGENICRQPITVHGSLFIH